MGPYTWWPGFPWMWIFPLMFLLAIVFLVILFTVFMRNGDGAFWWRRGGDDTRETPRQILDRRYASGEITKELYEEMKRNLER